VYHAVNRGNDRKIIYHDSRDYMSFTALMMEGAQRFPVRIFGYCLMPNHFHLLLEPCEENALSDFMEWVTGRYACGLRRRTETVGHGHVFQRRFWSAPVNGENGFLMVLRYIERNPVRGNLVPVADLWPWSSYVGRAARHKGLCALPCELPTTWAEMVHTIEDEKVLQSIRSALVRSPGRPRKS
jgi:putative transposase